MTFEIDLYVKVKDVPFDSEDPADFILDVADDFYPVYYLIEYSHCKVDNWSNILPDGETDIKDCFGRYTHIDLLTFSGFEIDAKDKDELMYEIKDAYKWLLPTDKKDLNLFEEKPEDVIQLYGVALADNPTEIYTDLDKFCNQFFK